MRKTDSGLSIIYFLPIYKEEIGDLFGEIKKMAMEAGVISVNSGKALRQAQDKLTELGLKSG